MWGFRDGARLGEDARDELLALQVGLQALFVWVDRDRDWRLDPQERRALLDARRGPSATPPPGTPMPLREPSLDGRSILPAWSVALGTANPSWRPTHDAPVVGPPPHRLGGAPSAGKIGVERLQWGNLQGDGCLSYLEYLVVIPTTGLDRHIPHSPPSVEDRGGGGGLRHSPRHQCPPTPQTEL